MMESELNYIHGGTPRRDMARFGLPERSVLDFSVNLNPLGPPPIIKERWQELVETIKCYPTVEGGGVARYYEMRFGVSSRNCLAGNGSTEMIYLAPRVLGVKGVAVITPSYHDYERASLLAGAEVIRCPLSPDNDFSFPSPDLLVEVIDRVGAIWIGRPNNPTGDLLPKEQISELADRFPEKWFILDEAFIQFIDDWETESFMTEPARPNIVVVHSLTKFYAIPGLRLGGIIGSEELIALLRKAKEPWTVNGIADSMAPLLLTRPAYEEESRSAVKAEREKVLKALEDLDGITSFPACANYILCQWTRTGNLDDLLRHLLLNGAYVRDCRNFPGLEKNFFRIGLKGAEENDLLLSLLSF